MPAMMLQHVNIRCADVEQSRQFYSGLGLVEGDRPPFASVGYWFYAGDVPVIHLVQAAPGERDGSAATGPIDHVALASIGLAETRAELARRGIQSRETRVPRDNAVQLVVQDPDGVTIELNFADGEASAYPDGA